MKNSYTNANMWQKSLIQQIQEFNSVVENFKSSIINLMEAYNINGNVFALSKGGLVEVNSGYLDIECEKTNIQEAVREIGNSKKCVRVLNNELFQIGEVYNRLSECDESHKIIDIENQTEIVR